MTSHRRRAAHAAFLAAAFSLAPLALAQQAPTPEPAGLPPAVQGPTPEQQRAAIDAISHGRPPQGLPAVPAGVEAKATRAPVRAEGAAIKEAVDALRAAIEARRAGKGSAEAIASAVENLRGADALLTASFDDALKRLRDSGADPRFEGRLIDARAKVRAPLDGVYGALGAAKPDEKSAGAHADAASVEHAATILRALPDPVPAAILRASTLPVRPVNLPVRAPLLSPTITPAYLAPDTAAQPADTTAGPEGPFSDEILGKAKDLGYDYVRIFEFVRNQVATEWYAGLQKGATGVLRTKAGNDVDQAALLVALLRASAAPARYVKGVVELPVEAVAAEMGLADASLVPEALGRAGIAYTAVVRGGRVALVDMEHTWVAAQVPYTNYRGVVLDTTGRTWLPLDASYKRLEGAAATPLLSALSLGSAALAADYGSADRNTDLLAFVRTRATSALPAGQTYAQALGAASITAQSLDLLPNTLPYTVLAVTRESAALDPAATVTVRLQLVDTATPGTPSLDATLPLYALANDRVTLSYDPATIDDDKVALLWGGIDLAPAYLVAVRPLVRIAGQAKASGTVALTPGHTALFTATITGPAGTQSFDQQLTVGAYHVLGFAVGDVSRPATAPPGDLEEADAARLLDGVAQSYERQWKAAEDELALLTGTPVMRPLPSLVMVNNYLRADTFASVSFADSWRGATIDAVTRVVEPVGAARNDWMELSALEGSSLEQLTFTTLFLVDTVSADRVLALAGAPVSINSGNVDAQLAATGHAAAVQDDIRNWIRQGYTVTTHANPFARNAWSGSAWVVKDSATKAAGYFLSGAIAGGSSTPEPEAWTQQFLADALSSPHASRPTTIRWRPRASNW